MFGIIFVKKFPQVYLVLKIFLMLNLSPILLDLYEIPLMYGMDIIHTFWRHCHPSSCIWVFLLITESTNFLLQ